MSAEIIALNEEAITVRMLAGQIASRDDLTALVGAVRDTDGKWHFINSTGLDAGALALAAIFIQATIYEKVLE